MQEWRPIRISRLMHIAKKKKSVFCSYFLVMRPIEYMQ